MQKNLNVSAVVSQCPYLGNSPLPPFNKGFVKSVFRAVLDVLQQAVGLSPKYMPAVARPGEVGLMTAPGNYEGMMGIVKVERYVFRDVPVQVSSMLTFWPAF